MQDIYRLESPGGGGYGVSESVGDLSPPHTKKCQTFAMKGSLMTFRLMQESS